MSGRGEMWFVRVRLYLAGHDDSQADTDPDRDVGAHGAELVCGLGDAYKFAIDTIGGFHAAEELPDMARKVQSLRVQLSRRKAAQGTMRLNYLVRRSLKIGGDPEGWTAVVDVQKLHTGDRK